MALPYRLCALDLDDTLLNNVHRLTPRTRRAIAQCVTLGVTVVLASGRMHAAMLPYLQELQLTTAAISYNGALVKNATTGAVWLEERVAAPLSQQIMAYCQEHGLQLNFYLNDILYSAADTPWLRLYEERTNAPMQIAPDLYSRFHDACPTKLVIVDAPDIIDTLLPQFKARFGSALYITKSNAEYLEFLPPTTDKGKALAAVAAHYDIPQSATLAFGDSWNDIPMIAWAGLGLAVANAKPDLKAVADRVIASNEDDGVAHALADIYGFAL